MALRLKRNGITRVRPLEGGLTLWIDRQFPTEKLKGLSPAVVAGVALAAEPLDPAPAPPPASG